MKLYLSKLKKLYLSKRKIASVKIRNSIFLNHRMHFFPNLNLICPNSKLYLSKWKKSICQNNKLHLSRSQIAFVLTNYVFPNHISELKIVLVKILNGICQNISLYYSKFKNEFVQIEQRICPHWKMHLSKLKNAFIQIENMLFV